MVDRPPLIVFAGVIMPITIGLGLAYGVMWLKAGRFDAMLFLQDFQVTIVVGVALTFVALFEVIFGYGPERCHRCLKRIWWHKVPVRDFANRHFDTSEWTGEVYEHVPTFAYHRRCYVKDKRNELIA